MPADTPDAPGAADAAPLPPREPHPLAIHIAVDAGVVLLATVILGWIIGVPILVIVAVAILAGLGLAPFTRRTEVRQLAERETTTSDGDGDHADPAEHGNRADPTADQEP